MPQLALFLSAIETAVNAYFKLDNNSLMQLKHLDDKVICLHITGLDIKLYFLPDTKGLQVLSNYGDTPDVTIHGSPMALMRLGMSNNSGKTLLDSDAYIEGNMGVANHFTDILKGIDIDWQERLSLVVGDIITQQTASIVEQSKGWLSSTHHATRHNIAEYLSEEAQLLVTGTEVEHYLDEVDALRADLDRIEARANRLQKHPQD